MDILRFLQIPNLVRKIISVLASLIIIAMPAKFFTTEEKASQYMLDGDSSFSQVAGDNWTVGFSKAVLTPTDVNSDKYYIAGYGSNNPAQGVLDDIFARAIYMDDNTGRGGVVMCAVDCVGLSRADINVIRSIVIESKEIPTLKSINIASTHAHSSVDTQGLWGEEFYKTGRNKAFMSSLHQKAAQTIIDAYKNSKDGSLFVGEIDAAGMQADVRTPVVFDSALTRIRFAPSDGSAETYLINFACHAELLGKLTTKISADFPAYMIKEIETQTSGANALFVNGAIGGMISAKEITEVYNNEEFDCEAYTKQFGTDLGELAMSISTEEELSPLCNIASKTITVKCDNTQLVLARFLGVLNNDIIRHSFMNGASILSEVSYLELGDEQISMFLIPGELYPELESGNFLPSGEAANEFEADYKVLSEMTNCKYSFVVGLCNDELGYIIPDNDFYLHEWLPYFNIAEDKDGREHYEETNSVGPETARIILNAIDALIASVK